MKHYLFFLFLIGSLFSQSQTVIKNVDALTFKKYIDENKSVLIDLRTNDELIKKGMIKGAKQIDFFAKEAETEIGKLDRKTTYLIYCAGGGRSGDCAVLMQKLGFKEVINLEKGFDDWKRRGLEVTAK